MSHKCVPVPDLDSGGSGWLWAGLSGQEKGYERNCCPQEDEQEAAAEAKRDPTYSHGKGCSDCKQFAMASQASLFLSRQ